MRVFIVTFALCLALVAGAAAQQTKSSNDEPKEKKPKNTEQAAKPQDKKPSQATEKARCHRGRRGLFRPRELPGPDVRCDGCRRG